MSAAGDAEVGRDGPGCGGVVAGDHLDLDPGFVASGDRLSGFGTGRVEDPDEGLETEILDQAEEVVFDCILDRAVVIDRAAGDRENPQAPCRKALNVVLEIAASSIVDGLRLAGDVSGPAAPVEQHLRRALDADLQAARGIWIAMERRHELVRRVKRDLGDPRAPSALDIRVDSGLGREHDESRLGRIAHDPAVVSEHAVVAHHRGHQRRSQVGAPGTSWAGDPTDRFVAVSFDVEHGAPPDRGGRHLIERQRPGLVAADHRRRAEGPDRGETLHDRVASGHPASPDRQRHRDDSRKALRDRSHCQPTAVSTASESFSRRAARG